MFLLFFLVLFSLLMYAVICNTLLGMIAGGLAYLVSRQIPALNSRWYAALIGAVFGVGLVALMSFVFQMSLDWTVFISASPVFAAYFAFVEEGYEWFP